jgi:hypothetical protein
MLLNRSLRHTDSEANFKGENFTLQKHSDITGEILLKSVDSYQVGEPKYFKIKGNNAVEYEIFGVYGNTDISYLHTTVETDKNYHQILVYTSQSDFDRNKPEFKKVINSFQEVK